MNKEDKIRNIGFAILIVSILSSFINNYFMIRFNSYCSIIDGLAILGFFMGIIISITSSAFKEEVKEKTQ